MDIPGFPRLVREQPKTWPWNNHDDVTWCMPMKSSWVPIQGLWNPKFQGWKIFHQRDKDPLCQWDWLGLSVPWCSSFEAQVICLLSLICFINYRVLQFFLYALNLRNLRIQSVIPGTCHKFPMLRSGHLSSSRERLQSQAGGAERSGSEGWRFFAEMCCRNM